MEKLMAPLKIFKAPVHEVAMMMSIALRFIERHLGYFHHTRQKHRRYAVTNPIVHNKKGNNHYNRRGKRRDIESAWPF